MKGLEQVLEGLHERLWTGPLADPQAPAQALCDRLPRTGYGPALAALRRLCSFALPVEPALTAALARWPWSIDLALVAVDACPGDAKALETLRLRCETQNRRRSAAAWAFWRAGQAGPARTVLAAFDSASETAPGDLACRTELALLDADWPAARADLARLEPWPEHHQRLLLQTLHLRDGAAALARYLDETPLGHSPHWRLAFDLLLQGRDYGRARALLDAATVHHGTDTTRDAAIQCALVCEAPESALALLEPALPAEPWKWSARQHEHWLRIKIGLARLAETPEPLYAQARQHADAAQRLHPRNAALKALWLTCRELSDDWAEFERDLLSLSDAAVVPALIRLGLFEAAQERAKAETAAISGANPTARRLLNLAETQLLSGALDAAEATLDRAEAAAPPAPTRADLALLRAEIALWRVQPERAEAVLASLRDACPQRMGLWLALARTAFLRGDFTTAQAALERFRALKEVQTGAPPPLDLRDRITADAAKASAGLPLGLLARPLPEVLAKAGAARIAASPGLSACMLARARPAFAPMEGQHIPRQIAFYWEGPPSSAVQRSVNAWKTLHPGFTLTLYDFDRAASWLARHHPALLPLFKRQSLPATRADLLRIALMHTEGGLYADVDEYPRAPVDDWLDGAQAVFCVECGHGTVANNFLAARPGLALFAQMLERIKVQLSSTEAPYPWWDTGPAPLTATVFEALYGAKPMSGLRLLDQAAYCQRISTNLPFPHKRGPLHWR